MGLRSVFVIADASEAPAVLAAPDRQKRWPSLELNDIDAIRIATLWAILDGKEPTMEVFAQLIDPIEASAAVSSSGESYVVVLPEALTNRYAGSSAAEVEKVAVLWSQTDELQRSGWTQQDAKSALKSLHPLAVLATRQGRSLLMWSSI